MNALHVALIECADEFDNEFGNGECGSSVWGSQLRELVADRSPTRTENRPRSTTTVIAEVLANRHYGHTAHRWTPGDQTGLRLYTVSSAERAALFGVAEQVVEALKKEGHL